jgi:hypothetical protein
MGFNLTDISIRVWSGCRGFPSFLAAFCVFSAFVSFFMNMVILAGDSRPGRLLIVFRGFFYAPMNSPPPDSYRDPLCFAKRGDYLNLLQGHLLKEI